ncbi:relaxase [Chryseobacterium sp. IHB B 17019]|uniref:conjugal transfer protein MobB n=1 Tax=Chryseobacterium sp. IHB B 17019 TaxID=1721091 RepID=UPI00071FE446|nr:conjugal transfer protein MobB [Chryseobacterium sp. IHB B 17019]ALR29226.1 relaxase [Chryseobacterium sp. IHB B 17019]
MIAKIGKGENLIGALSYNLLKVEKDNGQVLHTHNMVETLNGCYSAPELLRSFEPYLIANNKTEKPVLHISLNPHPRDEVNDDTFQAIAQDYMEQMGYGNQPFVVFKHTDIDRTHIHIVSICVAIDGKKISDRYDHLRSMKVSRELESKYQLIPVEEKTLAVDKKIFDPVNYQKGDIKSQIASVVRHLPKYYKYQSLGEYNALLSLFNITAEEVKGEIHGILKQGLVYFALNENGEKVSNPFKASLFGKDAGYLGLLLHLTASTQSLKNNPLKASLKKAIEIALHITGDPTSFKTLLLDQGINTVVRRNAESRIYGITFIDHNSKTVWNGSRLGKEFSANKFNDLWNNNHGPEIKMRPDESSKGLATSADRSHEAAPHNLFDFLNKEPVQYTTEDPGLIEALGGLLPGANGDNVDELLFENQIKRKRKQNSKK